MKTFILPIAMLAAIIGVALAPMIDNVFAQQAKPDKLEKPDKAKKEKEQKPKKCQVKVQVKIINAVNGTIYTAQLENLQAQSKQATEPELSFNFQFKKGGDACPEKGATVLGNINGEAFSGVINSLTKPNKVAVELAGTAPEEPIPIQ